jgi:hypothetical protein
MRIRTILVSAAAVSAPLASIGVATAAHAAARPVAPVTATATTALTDRLDSGFGGNNWASDTVTRTVMVSLVGNDSTLSDCGEGATSCYTYTGTLKDTGTAHAIAGQISPGAQAVPITGSPNAAMAGHGEYSFHASSNHPNAALVPTHLTGNEETTDNWVEQFFPAGTTFGTGPVLSPWAWTYTDSANCQTWTDAFNIGKADSGDITGVDMCPVLSDGHASVDGAHATITWMCTHTSTFELTIVGPGKINGKMSKVTKPEAVYGGLSIGHSYTVTIQPLVNGDPMGKPGKITFHTAAGQP